MLRYSCRPKPYRTYIQQTQLAQMEFLIIILHSYINNKMMYICQWLWTNNSSSKIIILCFILLLNFNKNLSNHKMLNFKLNWTKSIAMILERWMWAQIVGTHITKVLANRLVNKIWWDKINATLLVRVLIRWSSKVMRMIEFNAKILTLIFF